MVLEFMTNLLETGWGELEQRSEKKPLSGDAPLTIAKTNKVTGNR
jgi:hypothetical protein